jgi:predicted metallopeptidase
MKWEKAPDIEKRIKKIITVLQLKHINPDKVICFRSFGSTSKAIARIWGFPRIWQDALHISPHYMIDVLSPRFDKKSKQEQTATLIHELLHIPKNFSGALRPHKAKKWRLHKETDILVREYYKKTKKTSNRFFSIWS